MSDERRDDKPEFPESAATPAEPAAPSTPPMPAIPGWEPTGSRDLTPDRATPVVEETVVEEPAVVEQAPSPADGQTRAPIGGPYVVTETGAPVAEQAVVAYERQPIGGPYVTSSEPAAYPDPEPAAYAAVPAAAPVGEVAYAQYQPVPQPVAPVAPTPRGNRGGGTLLALAGTVVFAAVFAAVAFVIVTLNVPGAAGLAAFGSFLASAAFIVPVVVFAVSLILIVLIVNRAGWWAYVLGGFVVAVLVYVGGIAGALVHVQAWGWQPQEQYDFVRSLTMDPLTLAGAIIAREVSIWTGAVIAARGRRVKTANAAAYAEWQQRDI
ncbi:hypothetical protein N1031_12175 [Herbiconiux moechotypicola]|uniref:ABC transporter n=1 Tax=Herbiconiux moechotypicola TaxID=637393 RepID=A0ABN3DUR3_9MICO|nr:hypothetical protein [Herbiconiux moechotypicola]MCS5730520.1 hypothetical protein [Herbiconiux moechotypicola]